MRLTHVRLLVNDFPGCFRFYRDVMGFEPSFGDESGPYADFDAGSVMLALFDRRLMAEAIRNEGKPVFADAMDPVALVLNVDDVDETWADLAARGVPVVAPPMDRPLWGIRTAHLRDPDGNLIEIYTDLGE